VLLGTRVPSGHQDGRFIEGQDLAKGIVPAHRDDSRRSQHQPFHVIVEGDGTDVFQLLDAL
jgi:hypothetical protein